MLLGGLYLKIFRIPLCALINQHLNQLAMKFRATKFLKSISTTCVPNYPDRNLPTIFVYFEGDMKSQLMGPSSFRHSDISINGNVTVQARNIQKVTHVLVQHSDNGAVFEAVHAAAQSIHTCTLKWRFYWALFISNGLFKIVLQLKFLLSKMRAVISFLWENISGLQIFSLKSVLFTNKVSWDESLVKIKCVSSLASYTKKRVNIEESSWTIKWWSYSLSL